MAFISDVHDMDISFIIFTCPVTQEHNMLNIHNETIKSVWNCTEIVNGHTSFRWSKSSHFTREWRRNRILFSL